MKSTVFSILHQYYAFFLVAILFFALLTRLWRLDTPKGYMFDEVYHALTGKLMARNDPRAYEWWHAPVEPDTAIEWTHPPLGKIFHAVGIRMFGENEFGWRFSSVLFGVGAIYLVALIADHLFENKVASLLSAGLFSLEGLTVTQSRIAMNDIHLTFFILLTFFWYLRYKRNIQLQANWKKYLVLTGVGMGLTLATKWSGILIFGVIIIDQIFEALKEKKFSFSKIAIMVFGWIIVPLIVYLLSYSQMFMQGKDLEHFKQLNLQMWWYHSRLEATHPYQSTPLQWVTNTRPVWYYVNYRIENKIANVYAIGNSILLWSGLVSVLGIILKTIFTSDLIKIQEKKDALVLSFTLRNYSDPLRLLLMSYFVFWLPYLLSPRIMFFYHYLPAIPFLSIILGYSLTRIWEWSSIGKYLTTLIVLFAFLNFVIFYPHWSALPVTPEFQTNWYQIFESWK